MKGMYKFQSIILKKHKKTWQRGNVGYFVYNHSFNMTKYIWPVKLSSKLWSELDTKMQKSFQSFKSMTQSKMASCEIHPLRLFSEETFHIDLFTEMRGEEVPLLETSWDLILAMTSESTFTEFTCLRTVHRRINWCNIKRSEEMIILKNFCGRLNPLLPSLYLC